MMYVPPIVIEEVDDLRAEHKTSRRVEAFEKMADYARIGREFERIVNFKNLAWPVTRRRK
jgi:hypothetical protein